MNMLGYRSRRNLLGVHPDLIVVTTTCILTLPNGLDATVFDGIRTLAEQAENVARKVSKTMNSMHLPQKDGYGHAVDIVPIIDGKLMWEDKNDKDVQARIDQAFEDIIDGMLKAGAHHHIPVDSGFKMWGWDKPHFQLSPLYRQ